MSHRDICPHCGQIYNLHKGYCREERRGSTVCIHNNNPMTCQECLMPKDRDPAHWNKIDEFTRVALFMTLNLILLIAIVIVARQFHV